MGGHRAHSSPQESNEAPQTQKWRIEQQSEGKSNARKRTDQPSVCRRFKHYCLGKELGGKVYRFDRDLIGRGKEERAGARLVGWLIQNGSPAFKVGQKFACFVERFEAFLEMIHIVLCLARLEMQQTACHPHPGSRHGCPIVTGQPRVAGF